MNIQDISLSIEEVSQKFLTPSILHGPHQWSLKSYGTTKGMQTQVVRG